MTKSLDAVQDFRASALPAELVLRPCGSATRLTERSRHRAANDVARNLSAAAALELMKEEAVLESATQYFEAKRRERSWIGEHAVAVPPIAAALSPLVERDRVVHHVGWAAVIVAIGKIEALPRVPEVDMIPFRDPAPGAE